MQTSSRVPAHNQRWWRSHRQWAMKERRSILLVPFTIKSTERLCLISSGGETKLYRAGVLRGEVKGMVVEVGAPKQLLLFVYATQQHTSSGVPLRRLAGPPTLPAWSLKVGAVWTIPPSPPSVLCATICLPRNVGRVSTHPSICQGWTGRRELPYFFPPSELYRKWVFLFGIFFLFTNHLTCSPPTWN